MLAYIHLFAFLCVYMYRQVCLYVPVCVHECVSVRVLVCVTLCTYFHLSVLCACLCVIISVCLYRLGGYQIQKALWTNGYLW